MVYLLILLIYLFWLLLKDLRDLTNNAIGGFEATGQGGLEIIASDPRCQLDVLLSIFVLFAFLFFI